MKRFKRILPAVMLLLVGVGSAGNLASAEQIRVDSTNFPDAEVQKVLLNYYKEYDYDLKSSVPEGYIETSDINTFYAGENYGTISDLTGLDKLPNLCDIYIHSFSGNSICLTGNVKICSIESGSADRLDVSASNLESLWIVSDAVETINLNQCSNLKNLQLQGAKISKVTGWEQLGKLQELYVDDSNLTSIKVPSTVERVSCSNNLNLTSLDVKKCKKLLSLYASDNNLMSINVKNNTKLQSLYISGNKKITSVNVSKNKALQHLGVAATSVKKLDLSRNTKLTSLDCYQTKLTSLNLKKNKKINSISFYGSKIAKLDLKKYNLLSINYEANVGETIKLKKYLGTGYKATHKSKNLTYNKKKNTIKVKKNEDEWGYVTLKKGKKTYYISIYIPENVMQMEKK